MGRGLLGRCERELGEATTMVWRLVRPRRRTSTNCVILVGVCGAMLASLRGLRLLHNSIGIGDERTAQAWLPLPAPSDDRDAAAASDQDGSGGPWESSRSVVMGLATGLDVGSLRTFVDSLRGTGYDGGIVLGVGFDASSAADGDREAAEYLAGRNVTMRRVETEGAVCTYNGTVGHRGEVLDMQADDSWRCPKAYPDYKITWARFLFYRDWLSGCPECTDGVMLTDVRDAYFQRDPFLAAVQTKKQHPLMLFEEHPDMVNTHWLTDFPVKTCRGYNVGSTPVLCSGSIMGSREGIMDYLDAMIQEFDYWKIREKCRIDMAGDDQSIHNYLYYTGAFKNAITVPHRHGPIHVVGYQAARIWENATKEAEERGIDNLHSFGNIYTKGGRWKKWLPQKYGLLDRSTGFIVNMDGSPSALVHQVDRFGSLNRKWLKMMEKQNWPYNNPLKSGSQGIDLQADRAASALIDLSADAPTPPTAPPTPDGPCMRKVIVPRNFNTSLAVPPRVGERIYKVHLWDDSTYCKLREEMLITEGIVLNPRTTLVDSPADADIIFWVSTRGRSEKEIPPATYSNVVLLDYSDGCSLHQTLHQIQHLVGHFKRSFVQRDYGVYKGNCTDDLDVLPFSYSGIQSFVNHDVNRTRKYEISNLLRADRGSTNTNRKLIVKYTKSFLNRHNFSESTAFVGTIGSGGPMTGFDKAYLEILADSKIIVTCNPAGWEGDFRLWEALLSGALVFVDKMTILDWMPYPFEHGKHLIVYNPTNETEFDGLLEYYTAHQDEARAIAMAGYKYTLSHHMTTNRVSYVLSKIKSKLRGLS